MTISKKTFDAEQRRLNAHQRQSADWKKWGPYLAERAWGTVREDYSTDGNAWEYFPHNQARSRAYRWNEDGLAGICDDKQFLCFGLALWNGQDPFLKERLFGLSGPEGNHGEDVKELYWYLDSTPTYSYASMCYRYPQQAYPYDSLITENKRRGYRDREYELSDTGVLSNNRYFDIVVTYAKADTDDLLIKIDIHNRSANTASIALLPQVWFRNTWSWGHDTGIHGEVAQRPRVFANSECSIQCEHELLGDYHLYWQGKPELLFTENETNKERVFGGKNTSTYVKDAFHRYVVNDEKDAVNPELTGTKAALHYALKIKGNSSRSIQLRLCNAQQAKPFTGFKPKMDRRKAESDVFYQHLQSNDLEQNHKDIQRQALAGMLWSKQLYYYNVREWLNGDPSAPLERKNDRNRQWLHMDNFDIMSMPDKWEYPWYAVWDTAFHCLPLAVTDIEYAKSQLSLITHEKYMHPNGQLPAYEWSYGDVNPPVHAWACWNVYTMEKNIRRKNFSANDAGATDTPGDTVFLESVFHKLLLNFTWWVNRKDTTGNSIFEGGFLGLDNISLFDRSEEPPTGGILHQSDGTAWMGFFCACMLRISLELARKNPVYEGIAAKFFDHYLRISQAINGNEKSNGLWDETDGFFYDRLDLPDGRSSPIKVRSLVGLMPMIAASTLEADIHKQFPSFAEGMNHSMGQPANSDNRLDSAQSNGVNNRYLLSFLTEARLRSVLKYLLDEDEFLSPYGIRSLSKFHENNPYTYTTDKGKVLSIGYEAGEGETNMFGGNSNWRGPIWFPINYLLIESLRRYYSFYGDDFTVECPTHSGNQLTLDEVAQFITLRLIALFEADAQGSRPWCGDNTDLMEASNDGMHQFFEYFNGDTGEGLGASHQTGWTGLIALLLQRNLVPL